MGRRKTPTPGPFLIHAELLGERIPAGDPFPYCLPSIRMLTTLPFHPKVTFFVGENGSGKSTLLEAVAVGCGLNPEGGSRNFNFATRASHSPLDELLRLAKAPRPRPADSYFLRAESFYNVATEIERLGTDLLPAYGGRSLHEQSHGESFFALFQNRFRGNGLYLMDEPEAALSPQRQLEFLAVLHDYCQRGSQFVIATHSPIIMAYPDAWIYVFGTRGHPGGAIHRDRALPGHARVPGQPPAVLGGAAQRRRGTSDLMSCFLVPTQSVGTRSCGRSSMPEIYVSTDVEADGPIPGPHSMLSFASAAFTADKTLVGTFSANLATLPGAQGDPKTMAWWQTQPEAWAACRADLREPAEVMPEYVALAEGPARQAGVRRLPGGVRLPVRVLVPDPLRRREPVLPLGPGHQDLRDGPARHRVPRLGEAEHAEGVVRRRCRTRTSRWTTRSGRGRCSATCWRTAGGGSGADPRPAIWGAIRRPGRRINDGDTFRRRTAPVGEAAMCDDADERPGLVPRGGGASSGCG